jgi:hypothetical protein
VVLTSLPAGSCSELSRSGTSGRGRCRQTSSSARQKGCRRKRELARPPNSHAERGFPPLPSSLVRLSRLLTSPIAHYSSRRDVGSDQAHKSRTSGQSDESSRSSTFSTVARLVHVPPMPPRVNELLPAAVQGTRRIGRQPSLGSPVTAALSSDRLSPVATTQPPTFAWHVSHASLSWPTGPLRTPPPPELCARRALPRRLRPEQPARRGLLARPIVRRAGARCAERHVQRACRLG